MPRYSQAFKSRIIGKMLPPNAQSVSDIHRESGIPVQTLYAWKNRALAEGLPALCTDAPAHLWSDQAKVAIVIEVAALNEAELSEYCREKGLYPEQIKQWKEAAVSGQSKSLSAKEREDYRAVKAELKKVKKELARKEKALAEAAALLVLRKKAQAIFGDSEDE